MTTYRIGLLLGVSALALTVAGNPVAGWEAGGPPPITNATFDIVVETAPIAVAPHPQWFGVTNLDGFAPAAPVSGGEVHDPRAHDITWIWTFGEAGAVPNTATNLPTAWRDTNTAYGKRVAHVYGTSGTFTVTCWAYDTSGNIGSATAEITVQNPATYFTGNRTICLNPSGDSDFASAPAGSQQVNTWTAVQSAIEAVTQPYRVLLKRGATYSVSSWGWPGNLPNVYLGDYGTGALPVLRPSSETFNANMLDNRSPSTVDSNKFVNLDLYGWWDPDTETGGYANPINAFFYENNILIHGCRIRNFTSQVIGGPQAEVFDVIVSNSLIQNWRGFGIFAQGGLFANSRCAVIGTGIHQSPNAMQGHDGGILTHGLGSTNGPWRNGHMLQAFFSCTSMFANTGGSFVGSADRTQFPQVAINPAFRLQSDQGGEYSSSLPLLWNIERCTFEGGLLVIGMAQTNNGRPGNYILDKVIVLPNAQTYADAVEVATGGTTLRNVFVFYPNAPATGGSSRGFLTAEAAHLEGNATRPVRIYGCTFYTPRTFGDKNRINNTGDWTVFSDIVIENNVLHCPAQGVPLVASAPVELVAVPGLTTQYRGPRWNFDPLVQTLGSSVAVSGTVTFSYPNDTATHPNGAATDQAYFLTPPGNNRHVLAQAIEGVLPLRSWLGEMSVSFGASNITVTNTSGQTWPAGRTIYLLLDRSNEVGAVIAAHASPEVVQIPALLSGSAAIGAATGNVPFEDIYGRQRGTPPSWGAVEVNLA